MLPVVEDCEGVGAGRFLVAYLGSRGAKKSRMSGVFSVDRKRCSVRAFMTAGCILATHANWFLGESWRRSSNGLSNIFLSKYPISSEYEYRARTAACARSCSCEEACCSVFRCTWSHRAFQWECTSVQINDSTYVDQFSCFLRSVFTAKMSGLRI